MAKRRSGSVTLKDIAAATGFSANTVSRALADKSDISEETKEVIEGLRFIFVELPKFTPKNYGDKKMQVLWLRYLTEINDDTEEVAEDLLENPEINKAVTQLRESAFTPEQLLGYDKFWDIVSTAKTTINSALNDGKRLGFAQGHAAGLAAGIAEGRAEGRVEGRAEGQEEGRKEERLKIAKKSKDLGVPVNVIIEVTGLTIEEIDAL